jgi:hypothetical protein
MGRCADRSQLPLEKGCWPQCKNAHRLPLFIQRGAWMPTLDCGEITFDVLEPLAARPDNASATRNEPPRSLPLVDRKGKLERVQMLRAEWAMESARPGQGLRAGPSLFRHQGSQASPNATTVSRRRSSPFCAFPNAPFPFEGGGVVKARLPHAIRNETGTMSANNDDDFNERLSTAAKAKQALLKKFRARPKADDPATAERQAARLATSLARDARTAERQANREAEAARAIRLAAEDATREATTKAEQAAQQLAFEADRKAARDARYAARQARRR